MNKICGFCNQLMKKVNHTNGDVIDLFECFQCIKPSFDTRFRQIFYPGESELLATQFRIDEFHVILNYSFNFGTRRAKYTSIFKKSIGYGEGLEPYDLDQPVYDFDTVLTLPFHDPVLLKSKLQLYTLFS